MNTNSLVVIEDCDDVLTQKNALEKEIAAFEAELNTMIFDLSNDHPDLVQKVNSQPTQAVEKKPLDDANAKELWRLIANRCHPDKNSKHDKQLHDIFLRAKKCREEGNIADLNFCYLEMVQYTKENSLFARLMKNSPVIQESMEMLRKRYGYLKSSFYGKLYELYKIDRYQASIQFRKYLQIKMAGASSNQKLTPET